MVTHVLPQNDLADLRIRSFLSESITTPETAVITASDMNVWRKTNKIGKPKLMTFNALMLAVTSVILVCLSVGCAFQLSEFDDTTIEDKVEVFFLSAAFLGVACWLPLSAWKAEKRRFADCYEKTAQNVANSIVVLTDDSISIIRYSEDDRKVAPEGWPAKLITAIREAPGITNTVSYEIEFISGPNVQLSCIPSTRITRRAFELLKAKAHL